MTKETAMTSRKTASALTLAALLALPATIAAAQTSVPPPAQSPAPAQPGAPAISMEHARRIASENGVVRIEEIKLDDGKWEIEGRDSAGAQIEINLRASDGVIIKIERDRPVSAGVARP
jgi:uncharacterized membrane protein YkoI